MEEWERYCEGCKVTHDASLWYLRKIERDMSHELNGIEGVVKGVGSLCWPNHFAARGKDLVYLVSLVCHVCLVRRTRETRQPRALARLPLYCPPVIRAFASSPE
jgi:hypothetical protein